MKTFDERRKHVMEHMEHIRRQRRKTGVLTVTACLLLATLCGVLFVPYSTTPPDVSMYADSEYYAVIQQLNLATYQKPKYKNNFEALSSAFSSISKAGDRAPGASLEWPQPGGVDTYAPGNGEYVETTDNQVQGVLEADLIKRSDKYIFYLCDFELRVYSINGEGSELVGTYAVARKLKKDGDGLLHFNSAEMFLSQDCTTITVLLMCYSDTLGRHTRLMNLDVTDPANIHLKDAVYFAGDHISSRMVDGSILMMYNYRINNHQIDFDDPTTFVPQFGTPGNMQCIPGKNVVCPGDVTNTQYTVICKINADTLQVEGSTALLSYSDELYVSADTIYATHSYNVKNSEKYNNEYKQTAMTEITGISYAGDSLQILGTIALEGSVKDQYSMDQHEGVLRVVTSTAVTGFRETFYGENASLTTDVTARNVNLYCIDLSDWQVEASVIGFAPAGEEATSVRFDGVYAYVCTAEVITLTDPVYFFDLSDLSNITYTDTGIIDGYSTSLIQLEDGYLLGIGYNEERKLKIEIYEETENGVQSVCTYEKACGFSEVYKSYFIDREKNLIGLATTEWATREKQYILLHFDGYSLNVWKTMEFGGNRANVRGVLIDGFFYVLSSVFQVEPLE